MYFRSSKLITIDKAMAALLKCTMFAVLLAVASAQCKFFTLELLLYIGRLASVELACPINISI